MSDDFPGLLGMAPGADAKVGVWLGHFQLTKEDIGHSGVVMLAGVDQGLMRSWRLGQRAQDRRGFHEIGTSANNMKDVHAGPG